MGGSSHGAKIKYNDGNFSMRNYCFVGYLPGMHSGIEVPTSQSPLIHCILGGPFKLNPEKHDNVTTPPSEISVFSVIFK